MMDTQKLCGALWMDVALAETHGRTESRPTGSTKAKLNSTSPEAVTEVLTLIPVREPQSINQSKNEVFLPLLRRVNEE